MHFSEEKGVFWGGLLPEVVSGHQVTRGTLHPKLPVLLFDEDVR